MKIELVLKDETTIELVEASHPKHYVMQCKNAKAFQKVWNKMTDENLSEIQIKEEGEIKANIAGSRLSGTQTAVLPDGTMFGHFYVDGGDYIDPVAEETEEPEAME